MLYSSEEVARRWNPSYFINLIFIFAVNVQPDIQCFHFRYPPDTGWSRGTQILGAKLCDSGRVCPYHTAKPY